MRRALALLMLALAAGVAATLGVAAPASAHAVLVSSTPQNGARLDAAPAEVRFTFDEAVQLTNDSTSVLADSGASVGGVAATADGGRTVVVPLLASLPDAAYTASYRVVSADGHVVAGAIRFGVRVDPGIVSAPAVAPIDPLEVAADAAQGGVYGGLVLALGVAAATAAVWRPVQALRRLRGLRIAGWLLLVAATLLRLALAGPVATGAGVAGILALSGLGTTLTGIAGVAAAVRLALAIALLPWILRPARGGRAAAAALALGILVTVALDGHAAAGDDAVLAVIVTVLHLAAMAFWVGGLLVLVVAVLPRFTGSEDDRRRYRRWARLAFGAVAVLVLSGEYQAWRQLDPVDSLVATPYGVTLLIKLLLVVLALAAALVAHRLLDRAATPRRIRGVAVVESAVTIAVVVVTTVLVALPPARTTYGPPAELTAPLGTGRADIRIDTTRSGVETFTVRTVGTDAARSVSGTVESDSAASLPLRFTQNADGSWTARTIVPVAGEWTVQLSLDLGTGGDYSTSADYRVW